MNDLREHDRGKVVRLRILCVDWSSEINAGVHISTETRILRSEAFAEAAAAPCATGIQNGIRGRCCMFSVNGRSGLLSLRGTLQVAASVVMVFSLAIGSI
jgi:hypothetical protein